MPDEAQVYQREAVAVFHNAKAMQAAVDDLLTSGFNHADLSVLASEKALASRPDLSWRRSEDLADEPQAASASYVSPESFGDAEGALIGALTYVGAVTTAALMIGAGGPIGVAILASAAVGGTGGGVGIVLARFLMRRHANELAGQLERGGLLLWVRTRLPVDEERALRLLRANGGESAHIHDIVPDAVLRESK